MEAGRGRLGYRGRGLRAWTQGKRLSSSSCDLPVKNILLVHCTGGPESLTLQEKKNNRRGSLILLDNTLLFFLLKVISIADRRDRITINRSRRCSSSSHTRRLLRGPIAPADLKQYNLKQYNIRCTPYLKRNNTNDIRSLDRVRKCSILK